jgi:GcrA cell cycle regulator
MSIEWNESRTELLRRLWIAGESARSIAEKLGRGVTRNAVIGKAHRLGLTGKHGSKDASRRRARNSAPKPSNRQPKAKPNATRRGG